MSHLLKEIRSTNSEAARVLEEANVRTDAEIQLLTREDLCELLPGARKFKVRRTIFEIIHKQKPVDMLIRELKDFVPQESFRAALTNNGVLVDYLRMLKDLQTQINNVHGFIEAHVSLLEEFSQSQPEQGSPKGSLSGASTSSSCGPVETLHSPKNAPGAGTSDANRQLGRNTPTGGPPQKPQYSSSGAGTLNPNGQTGPYNPSTGSQLQRSQQRSSAKQSTRCFQEVTYHVVVSGKTFGAEEQLMNQVKEQFQGQVRLNKSSEDHKITIVFCPVVSRVGSDVEAAMRDIKDDKPVILVLMHYIREVKCTPSLRTWSGGKTDVVLDVNVFYHDTASGLLKCQQNTDAASEIGKQMQMYSTERQEVTSGCDMDTGRDKTGRNSGNEKGSYFTGSGSWFGRSVFGN